MTLTQPIERCESGAAMMEGALWMALLQSPQSFANLWPTANRAAGHRPDDTSAPGYRFADRWLQAHRRKGVVAFKRSGRTPMWSLTQAGREAALRALQPKEASHG